ncbi:MAG: hypothetical protein K0R69_913 [Clostridia bacterium]|jgi:hypothetical protein|nr:hypothetical protein [Clostridia bacterium]
MELWLGSLLKELNSISRMAILENAFETEKMLRSYSKILKYRWGHEGNIVIASSEFEVIKTLCEFYQSKWHKTFHFEISQSADTKSLFIPHYGIMGYLSVILESLENETRDDLQVTVTAEGIEGHIVFCLLFTGGEYFEKIYSKAQKAKQGLYDSIPAAEARWTKTFGENGIQVKIQDKLHLKILFTVTQS